MAFRRAIRNAGVHQNLTNQGMAMQPGIRPNSPQVHPARVVPTSQVIAQTRVEISIYVKHIAFAMLASFDDGLVGRESFAYSKAGGAIAVSSDDECPVANGRSSAFNFLNSVYFDGTFSPFGMSFKNTSC